MADKEQTVKKTQKEKGPRSNQKLKLLYLMDILLKNTDKDHDITLQEIIDKLAANNVTAERKSLYDDIAQLRQFGLDIQKSQYAKTSHYKVVNRDFELAELKLLVDSVQSAKFIPEDISNDLIKKIEKLASREEAAQLQRQVYVAGRVKTINKEIMINVDTIHKAIASDVQISFQYYQWNVKKEAELRKGGKRYEISPWGLVWDDENYYMIGYDSEADMIKHYRVDKMLNIGISGSMREGKSTFKDIDLATYTRKKFSMFDGDEQIVEILCKNELAGVMIDKFGKDVHLIKADDEHFRVVVSVATSKHFVHWIMALGDGAKIIGPDSLVQDIRKEIERLSNLYK